MTPKVITESATEPITLEQAALNLRVSLDTNSPPAYPEAARITSLITAARRACEEELEVSLVAKTLEVAADSFASDIELPLGPVRSIVSVTYQDDDGVDTVLAASQYRYSDYLRAPVLLRAYDVDWPTARTDLNSIRVRYTAGYPSTDSPAETVPEPILQAMHLCIAHWFSNREAVDVNALAELPMGVRYLLGKYRQNLGV